jgi:pyruvate dehydrogenase E2 component (dihydrolipoamide acetyltransferase)
MATPIEMPKLGNTVEECLIAKWLKRIGDTVVEGEPIAEIETDKATFELTSPVGGTVLAVFFNDGDLVPVFTNVCVVGAPGESIDGFKPKTGVKDSTPVSDKPQAGNTFAGAASTSVGVSTLTARKRDASVQASYSPRARRFALEHNFYPEGITGSGPDGRVLESDLKELYFQSPRISSVARKFMEEGFELRDKGSGAGGMVLADDLTQPVKMSAVRERIARRMRESLATTAQYTMNTSAVATGLLSLRDKIKERSGEKNWPDINVNEIVMFCVVRAIEAVPEMNAELVGGKLYRHSRIHLAFACDSPNGLLAPVIKDCRQLTLLELALKMKALVNQVLEGSIGPDDLSGGTFTVSNLGIYGIESFSPILNPPQVAILGVNSIELKPVRRNGNVAFVDYLGLSLTCDHQVIDGAPAARFLKVLTKRIEGIETFPHGLDITAGER